MFPQSCLVVISCTLHLIQSVSVYLSSAEHIRTIKSTEHMKPRDLQRLGNDYNSIYISNESYTCALMAAGSCFNSVQAILTSQVCHFVIFISKRLLNMFQYCCTG